MSEHYITICKRCNDIINQCRCAGPKVTRYRLCDKCFDISLKLNVPVDLELLVPYIDELPYHLQHQLNKGAYFQGTSDPKKDKGQKDTATPKERQDRDVRKHVLFRNYDYTDEGPSETSPGGGLYHGSMGKYKSVKEFLDKRRSQNKKLDRNSQTTTADKSKADRISRFSSIYKSLVEGS